MDQHRGQIRKIAIERRDQRLGGRGAGAVERRHLVQAFQGDHRIAFQLDLISRARLSQVGPGADHIQPSGLRQPLGLERQSRGQAQAAARGIAGDDDARGGETLVQQPAKGRHGVLDSRRMRMFRGQAIVEIEGDDPGGLGQPGGQVPMAAGTADRIAAPVQIEDRAGRVGALGRQPLGRHAAHRQFLQRAAFRQGHAQPEGLIARPLLGDGRPRRARRRHKSLEQLADHLDFRVLAGHGVSPWVLLGAIYPRPHQSRQRQGLLISVLAALSSIAPVLIGCRR